MYAWTLFSDMCSESIRCFFLFFFSHHVEIKVPCAENRGFGTRPRLEPRLFPCRVSTLICCTDWWNVWWFHIQSDSSIQMNAVCLIWLQPRYLVITGCVLLTWVLCSESPSVWPRCYASAGEASIVTLYRFFVGNIVMFWLAEAAWVIDSPEPSSQMYWRFPLSSLKSVRTELCMFPTYWGGDPVWSQSEQSCVCFPHTGVEIQSEVSPNRAVYVSHAIIYDVAQCL